MNDRKRQNIERFRERVAELDALNARDEDYVGVFSSLGREVKWHKYRTCREAVVAKINELERRIS